MTAGMPREWRQRLSVALGETSFVRQVGETYATQVFVVALGFVNSVLVTRLLGPEGRGLFAAANTFSAVGIQLGNLGLHSWNTYHVSREPRSLPVLIGNSLAVCAAVRRPRARRAGPLPRAPVASRRSAASFCCSRSSASRSASRTC